jgi:hypothetical protein
VTAVQSAPVIEVPGDAAPDNRGSWIPTLPMITTRLMELRRRRGLMILIGVVTIALPAIFLGIRLILHVADPKSYGPAGGSDIFTGLVAGVIYVFGFIVAATLGVTAGSSDLTDGMFRHLVVTGRSRVALYFARIPAGLAIIVSMMAVGFTIICVVCSFAAPTSIGFDGVNAPANLSRAAFVTWSLDHSDRVICSFDYNVTPALNKIPIPCGPNGLQLNGPGPMPTAAQIRLLVTTGAEQNYSYYATFFLSPSISLMVESGLWLLLEATIGFIVGLGLGSLLGQRTVGVILMIVLEIILTPLFATTRIPYLLNVQRAVVGIATAHLEPNGLSRVFGAGGGPNARSNLVPETTVVAVIVIIAWLVVWTAIGAWRMRTRDA